MLNSLFLNVCIMITFVSVSYQLFKNKQELVKRFQLMSKVILGVLGGLLGSMLMINTVELEATVIVDFRNFAVVLSAIFGGPVSAFITASIIAATRISLSGISRAAIAAVISVFLIGLCSCLFSLRLANFRQKWLASFYANIIIGTFALTYLLYSTHNLVKVIIYFICGSSMMAYFLYKLIQYYFDLYSNYVKLRKESTLDFLTGLNNVRGFDIEFNKSISRCSRKGERLAFLALDIDFFKKVNDTYGHASGDLVLKSLANLLVDTCRLFDIISRNGGEEFSVILQDCPTSHAVEVAERIRKTVETTEFKIKGEKVIHITISIGIASFPDNNHPEMLIHLADKALYQAKHSGRNCIVLYEHADSEQE